MSNPVPIYLNNAATSYPKPETVLKSVIKLLCEPPFHHARTGLEQKKKNIVLDCRKALSVFFNAPNSDRMVFTSGATESLNLAIKGLCLKGKHVITTAVDHNSVLRPLKTMERDGLITLSIVGCDKNGCVSVTSIEKEICAESGAIIVNHCSNVTGIVNDIEKIGKLAKLKNIPFIVDASQSAGVYPIDVQQMNIDILVFTGHKSLYGIQGIGGLYIREDLDLQPLIIGGTGVRSDYLFQPKSSPMYYEAGTQNLSGIVSLYEGIKYINQKGMAVIRKRKEELVLKMRNFLLTNDNVSIFPDKDYKQPTIIFSFNIKGMDPADIGYILENNFAIISRSGLHCAPLIHKYIGTFPEGSVRISPSFFTMDADIDFFIVALEQILKMV